MHDLNYFRNNLEQIAARLSDRGFTLDVEEFRRIDAERSEAITAAELLQALRNSESAEISKLRQQGLDTTERQQKVREIGERITQKEKQAGDIGDKFRTLMAGIPNLSHESVPKGRSAEENAEVRRCGDVPKFDFQPKAHWDLGPELGILDLPRAAKVAGARFSIYWGLGA
jgi:seryl-tRNA synthetase